MTVNNRWLFKINTLSDIYRNFEIKIKHEIRTICMSILTLSDNGMLEVCSTKTKRLQR